MRIILLGLYCLCLPLLTGAQAPLTYKNLVLEGSGIRGIVYGGALEEMQAHGMLDSIKRVAGTSGGGIAAVALAVGYRPAEVDSIIYNTEFRRFNDGRLMFLGGFHRLLKWYGWYRGEAFSKWMGALIACKAGSPNLTFMQLHQMGGKDLYLTGTSLNRQQTIVFSYESYPDMRIRDAARITMSVPLYFQAVYIDSAGKVIRHPRNMTGLDIMVDGGILANFPIHIFDEARYLPGGVQAHADTPIFNRETLGIRIDTDSQMAYDRKGEGLSPMEIQNFSDYIQAFYALTLESLNRNTLRPEDWGRTISCSSMDIGPRVKHLSNLQKDALVESGRKGVQAFLLKDRVQGK